MPCIEMLLVGAYKVDRSGMSYPLGCVRGSLPCLKSHTAGMA